jgi:uncharacterized delta-60 repeat protein
MKMRFMKQILVWVVAVHIAFSASAGAWQTAVNGRPTSDRDNALDVDVDSVTGNIFVAGNRQISANASQFFVAKFTSSGKTEWQETVSGSEDLGETSRAKKVAVDANGFVYVAGTVGNTDSGTDFVVMKIDGRTRSRKRVLWTRIFDGGFGDEDIVNAMTLTPDNGVVIAGSVSDQKLYLIKLTTDGKDAWLSPQIVTGSAVNGFNTANAVAALSDGDIAVTGSLTNVGSNQDFAVARFNGTTGEPRWFSTLNDPSFNGNDLGRALAIADNGDIVAGGITQHLFAGSNFSVFRFSGTGVLLWQAIINSGFFDTVRTVAVAPNGNIIAGGTLEPPSGPDQSKFFVVNLGANGQERWRYESSGPSFFLEALDIDFDHNGNVIVTGQTQESDQALTTFTVVSLDIETGGVLWNIPIVGSAPFTNAGQALVSDPKTGAAVAVGMTQNSVTSFDLTITSIDDGNENWRRNISGPGERIDRDDAALAVAVDPRRDNIALAGYAQNTGAGLLGTPQEFRLVNLRTNGRVAWRYDFNDSAPHINNAALAVVADSTGDFFVAGRTCSNSVSCFTVVRVGRNGKEIWRKILPGLIPGGDEARAIIQDPKDGNLIVAGNVQMPSGTAFAVFKLDAKTGAVLWPTSVASLPLGSANALALTSRGSVAVAGSLQGSFAVLELDTGTGSILSRGVLKDPGEARSVAFDDDEGTIIAAGSQRSGIFTTMMTVAKFAGDGTAMWSKNLGVTASSAVSVSLHEVTGTIGVGGTLFGNVFTVILLAPNGNEQWRMDNILGRVESISFAQNKVIAAGQFSAGNENVFAVVAFGLDKTEEWRRTFSGTADFGLDSAFAIAFNEKGAALFAAGVITENPTGPDMFAVGLRVDGTDLPGSPVAPESPSARRRLKRPAVMELGLKTSGR